MILYLFFVFGDFFHSVFQAVQEIRDQFEGMGVPFPDYFVLSVGSGGTAIGIALGVYLLDLPCKVGLKHPDHVAQLGPR